MNDATIAMPSLAEIRAARERLGVRVRETPVWHWQGEGIGGAVADGTQIFLKLELFQHTGTFKARGALLNALALDDAERQRGVTAVSAGNHAIAVAFAARAVGTSARVVMPKSANPARVARCRDYGAETVLTDDIHTAFEEVKRIEREEGRSFIHPFEGERTVLGTATVGLEWARQAENMDAVIVPIGGGGLIAGIASAVKQMQPGCQGLRRRARRRRQPVTQRPRRRTANAGARRHHRRQPRRPLCLALQLRRRPPLRRRHRHHPGRRHASRHGPALRRHETRR